MVPAFVAGALAGWAVALPGGALAAVVGGTALAAVLEPLERPLRIIAIGALLAIGLRGLLLMTIAKRNVPSAAVLPTRVVRTNLRFLRLTTLSPHPGVSRAERGGAGVSGCGPSEAPRVGGRGAEAAAHRAPVVGVALREQADQPVLD